MGHYDSYYEDKAEKALNADIVRAKQQLQLIEDFHDALVRGPGTRGISARHLDALQDFENEVKLRAMR